MLLWQTLLALGAFASVQVSGRAVTFSGAPAPFTKVVLVAEHPFGLEPPLVRETTANEQGRFQFTLPHPMDRTAFVVAHHPQWGTGWSLVSLVASGETVIALQRPALLSGQLRDGGKRILRVQSLQPFGAMDLLIPILSLTQVSLDFLRVETDEEGQFAFASLPDRSLAVVEVDEPVCYFEVPVMTDLLLTLPPTGNIVGQVRRADGEAVPHVPVQFVPLNETAAKNRSVRLRPFIVTADAEGRFNVRVVEGAWLVWLLADGKSEWVSRPMTVRVREGQTVTLSLVAQRPGIVRGWVADQRTRFPLPRLFVRARTVASPVFAESGVAQPLPEGAYELHLPDGEWELFVADYGWHSIPVTVTTAERAVIEAPAIFARPFPAVSLRVADKDGNPIRALFIDAWGNRGVTDEKGHAIWSVPDGQKGWLLAATFDGTQWAKATLAEMTETLHLQLRPGVIVEGVVRRSQQQQTGNRTMAKEQPVAGALVTLWLTNPDLCLLSTRSDADGRFQFLAPPLFPLRLQAQVGNLSICTYTLPEPTASITLFLP